MTDSRELKNLEGRAFLTIGQFGRQALDVVKSASLLVEEDIEALANIRDELQHTWEHKQQWRTECEIRNSVLVDSKFPTPDAKYWQAIREQDAFFSELVRLSYDYRKFQQDIKIAEADKMELEEKLSCAISETAPEYKIIKLQAQIDKASIELDEKVFQVKNMQLAARDRVREIKIWSKVKSELEPHLQFGVDNPNGHQSQSYLLRFHSMVRSNLVTGGFAGSSVGEINNILSQYENLIKDPANAEVVERLGLQEAKEELEEQRKTLILSLGYDKSAASSVGHILPPLAAQIENKIVTDHFKRIGGQD